MFQYRICLFCFQLPAPVEDFDQIVILSDEEGEVSPPLPAMDPATVDIIKNALKEIQELQCLDSFWIPIVSWRWILDPYNVYFPSRSFYYIYIYIHVLWNQGSTCIRQMPTTTVRHMHLKACK